MTVFRAAAILLALAGPAVAAPETGSSSRALGSPTRQALIEELEDWLDANTELPRSAIPLVRVALIAAGDEVSYEGRLTRLEDTVRGLYDEGSATIYLVRPWSGDTAWDRSVLLHELVHHRQAAARHWYCPQAMEWDAYRIQESYLDAHGQTGDFQWGWVLLVSSCASRDHHPD